MPVIFSGGSFQARPVKGRMPRIINPTGVLTRLPDRDSLSLFTNAPTGPMGKPAKRTEKRALNRERHSIPNPCEVCDLSIGELGDLAARRCFRHRLDVVPPRIRASIKANEQPHPPCGTPPYRGAP